MLLPLYSYEQYKTKIPQDHLSLDHDQLSVVREIIAAVRQRGDQALKEYSLRFDQAELTSLIVSEVEIAGARQRVEPYLLEALGRAKENITRFHRRQLSGEWWEEGPGWVAGQRTVPLDAVGAYVPGGTAAYPSSVLMTVVPAVIAGVKEIYICTPPDRSGQVSDLTLAAAYEAGATAIFKIGGAQAIAALAYGTETVPAVQKIVGPGNIYVTLAKKEVFGRVGIDMLAGPSEVVIVADGNANPAYLAADLLSQAEHDPLSRSILITMEEQLITRVNEHLTEQLISLPRQAIARESLQNRGAAILVNNLDDAWPVVNDLAPEHLELHLDAGEAYLDQIVNAGAIFVGEHTPESVGDYWAGSNHVLPTAAAARYASPLSVADFVKKSHILAYRSDALAEAAPFIAAMARAEGLEAHARAVLIRRQSNESSGKD